jgi:hypothetical protein
MKEQDAREIALRRWLALPSRERAAQRNKIIQIRLQNLPQTLMTSL